MTLRRNTDDTAVLMQVMLHGEYDVPWIPWQDVLTIIDAGANIGVTSLHLADIAPRSTVLAVEPEAENISLLSYNLAALGSRAQIIEAALWPRPGDLSLTADGPSVAHQVTEGTNSRTIVPAITPSDLLDRCPGGTADVLKLDIEGAEADVAGDPGLGTWVTRVRYILIECHSHYGFGASPQQASDWLRPHGLRVHTYDVAKGLVCAVRDEH